MKSVYLFFTILCLLLFSSCSKNDGMENRVSGLPMQQDNYLSQREKSPYLAYEHHISIIIVENNLAETYKKVVDACLNKDELNCTIMDSGITTGRYSSSNILMRVAPCKLHY